MWFKQLLSRSKRDSSASTTAVAANRAPSVVENPPVKAAATRHDAASHRQPLGVVSNMPVDRHRPAEEVDKKPAKAARIDPSANVPAANATAPANTALSAPAPTLAPAPVATAPAAEVSTKQVPPPEVRRKEFGTCPMDIDTPDAGDPMFCSTYVQEIYDYLREKEVEDMIDSNYMTSQKSISPRMRTVLVDWMVEVQLKFRMTSETLYLSVNIVDKYLQKNQITRDKLQLLGVTAMLIASKFEEIFGVEINDFVYICDSVCTADQMIKFEAEILSSIHWSLTSPCPLHFLRRYSKAANGEGLQHTMSKYLLELALGNYNMLRYLPSTQAAAAVLLTRHLTGVSPVWPDSVRYHSGYNEEDILDCARALLDLVKNPDPKYRLVTRKYSGPKLCGVARIAAENAPKVSL